MKVAVVMQDTRGVYGAERATVEMVRGLKALGLEVQVWLLEEARSATAMSPRAMRSRASRKRRRSCADHLASLSSSRAPLARSREARVDRTGNP